MIIDGNYDQREQVDLLNADDWDIAPYGMRGDDLLVDGFDRELRPFEGFIRPDGTLVIERHLQDDADNDRLFDASRGT